MTLTRIGLLVVALAVAASPACKERAPERQAMHGPARTSSPAAEQPATETARAPRANDTARAPLDTGLTRVALEATQATPAPGDTAITIANEANQALAAGGAAIQGPEPLPHIPQHARTEADMRRAIDQIQARMNDELARARSSIIELQRANTELRQALAAERQQLAELHKRLTSGRSIALQ